MDEYHLNKSFLEVNINYYGTPFTEVERRDFVQASNNTSFQRQADLHRKWDIEYREMLEEQRYWKKIRENKK